MYMEEFVSTYNYGLLGILVVVAIVILYVYISYKSPSKTTSDLIIKESKIKGAGRGVYANKNYKQGEIIETCPMIDVDVNTTPDDHILQDYIFDHITDENKRVLVFGYGSMYNHSDDYNVDYDQTQENTMVYTANRDIQKGEELYISYGDDYWNSRNN